MTLYNFGSFDIQGNFVSFDVYAGKIVLIVNTASECVFATQYEGLQQLYEKYKEKGFVILAFPCNQFAYQEPADEYTIKAKCLAKYKITFPVFSKVEVNGTDAIALFKWLKTKLPGFLTTQVKWNFTKFLIDQNGKPIKRFSPYTTPEKIEEFLLENYFGK
ncbi:MAG TPA: glutathione peroxidase [Crocinitomicaceae bacterium]|nr:glutathione peroxidase [Crocinitomicaceae bacterium]